MQFGEGDCRGGRTGAPGAIALSQTSVSGFHLIISAYLAHRK